MFDARAFVTEMTQKGFALAIKGDRLTVTPASRLTDPQRAEIRRHKPALLWQLRHMGKEVTL